MKILIISRYKSFYADHQLPFVTEQGEAIRALGFDVEFLLMKGNYLTQYKSLREKIKQYKPDLIHAHFGLTACVAELQNCVPVVATFHNGETGHWYVNLVSSLMSLRAKHVVYVAQHIRDLCYFKAKHYSIIPCGVPMEQMVIIPKDEARQQLGWATDKKYILFGGAFDDERKNYTLLCDAVEKLNNETSYMKPHTSNIECIEMKNLTRSQCVLRMCAADLFVLPSHSEGSPQALKEAMAVNCPCIATDIADVRELFGSEPGHWVLRNPRKTHERWEADEKSLDEMVALLKEALAFNGRTNGRNQIVNMHLFNNQVAKRIIDVYEQVLN